MEIYDNVCQPSQVGIICIVEVRELAIGGSQWHRWKFQRLMLNCIFEVVREYEEARWAHIWDFKRLVEDIEGRGLCPWNKQGQHDLEDLLHLAQLVVGCWWSKQYLELGLDWRSGKSDYQDLPAGVQGAMMHGPGWYGTSRMGYSNDRCQGNEDNDDDKSFGDQVIAWDSQGTIIVRSMKMNNFQQKLVQHFDIAFKRNGVCWPKARMNNQDQPDEW